MAAFISAIGRHTRQRRTTPTDSYAPAESTGSTGTPFVSTATNLSKARYEISRLCRNFGNQFLDPVQLFIIELI